MSSSSLLAQNPAKDENALTGTIPSDIGFLTGLEFLSVCTCYQLEMEIVPILSLANG
jgi:hypothetical protein